MIFLFHNQGGSSRAKLIKGEKVSTSLLHCKVSLLLFHSCSFHLSQPSFLLFNGVCSSSTPPDTDIGKHVHPNNTSVYVFPNILCLSNMLTKHPPCIAAALCNTNMLSIHATLPGLAHLKMSIHACVCF